MTVSSWFSKSVHSGVEFSNFFQQEIVCSLDFLWFQVWVCHTFIKKPQWSFSTSSGKWAIWPYVHGQLPGLFSVYLNYGGRGDKNTKTKKSFFSPQNTKILWAFHSLLLFLPITMNNGSCCCFYWLSIWGHKNVNVSLRKNTFGGLTRLFLLF